MNVENITSNGDLIKKKNVKIEFHCVIKKKRKVDRKFVMCSLLNKIIIQGVSVIRFDGL